MGGRLVTRVTTWSSLVCDLAHKVLYWRVTSCQSVVEIAFRGREMIRIGSIDEQHHPHGGARGDSEPLFVVRPRAAMDDWLRQ